MMRRIKIYLIITVLTATLSGQAQSWLDYDQTLSPHSWLRTVNPAALTTYLPSDSTQHLLADAQVGITTGQGHLAPLNASPNTWQVDAAVRSIYRMNPRVVVRGSMDYRNCWGKNAGGSVWIYPDEMPFDITEYNDSTLGDIGLESYHLHGEVGVNAWSGLSLGAYFGYATASSTKKKDPRHTNSRMVLNARAGATWQTGGLTLGANYLLRRTTEALQFSTYGRTDRVYGYLIDYGALFGRDEQTDGRGYVGSDNEKPLLDMRHGVALQAGYAYGPWSAVVEWQWLHRHGHYGLESPSMLDFNRHSGNEWHLHSWWQHATPQTIHRITAQWSHEALKDHERTYRIITEGGVTDIDYYDDRLMGERKVDDITVGYDLEWDIKRCLATWQTGATVSHHRREVTASVYPYYRQQQTRLTDITLTGRRNWLTHNEQVWSLTLEAGWATGEGTAASDGTYASPAEGAIPPAEHTLYLMRQYEWLTANRVHGMVSLRWSMPLAHQRFRLYAQGSYRIDSAQDIHYLENGHRHTVSVAVGCLF